MMFNRDFRAEKSVFNSFASSEVMLARGLTLTQIRRNVNIYIYIYIYTNFENTLHNIISSAIGLKLAKIHQTINVLKPDSNKSITFFFFFF